MAALPDPDPKWAPAWLTPSLHDWSDGPDVAAFAEKLMRAPRGFKAGEPLQFTAWQRWLVDRIFERRAEDGLLRWCELNAIPARPLRLVGYEDEPE